MIKMERLNLKFETNSMTHSTIGMKGQKEYYVTGYISTEEIDRALEVVSKEAMQEMVQQIKEGNIKLDIEHSTFMNEADIAIGKIVDAGIDEKGLWVKCILNKDHSKFNEVWQSIKNGFLDAFSIAYNVKNYVEEVIDGINVTILKSLELLNVAITGNPVCRGAKMTESFYKSAKFLKEKEVKNIMENEKQIEAPIEKKVETDIQEQEKEVVIEKKVETEVQEQEKEVVIEKEVEADIQEQEKEVVIEKKVEADIQEQEKENKSTLELIKSLKAENEELKTMLKSLKESNSTFNSELKNIKSLLEKPVLKSIANTDLTKNNETKKETGSILDSIF